MTWTMTTDKSTVQQQLEQLLEQARPFAAKGKVATYIPELAKVDPSGLGISVTFMDGTTVGAGDTNQRFTLQSISKIITLMVALADHGIEGVFSRVGMEPTGDPFNSIVKLETITPHRPLNPMINAGAIAVTSMIKGADNREREERILDLLRRMTGNTTITVNEEVYVSESQTADRNRALAYFMRDTGVFTGDINEILELYFRHCAIEMNAEDISRIGAIVACDGKDYLTGEQIVPAWIARICKTFMVTCGMYNASGEFAISVGIPAKSGVAGGILACVPNKLGIGIYGPALDEKGNSIAGVKLLEGLSQLWNLSIF